MTIFLLFLKEKQELFSMLSKRTVDSVNALLKASSFFEKGEFARGKVGWLRHFPKFDFGCTGAVNVWGNECVVLQTN